ncbi:MAG: restriction endonuclease [Brevundimonas sp.]|uniref:restriction endonuclease n=1 Tax=Brevundimonas sp. TaxID=1871086 RepID=UPI00185DBB82|nr:restriction endonuclease [Brevundimonas sp.]MBA4805423.1 restriction endonuclease [Brevundimonas sp.]
MTVNDPNIYPPFRWEPEPSPSMDAAIAAWMISHPETISLGFQRSGGRDGMQRVAQDVSASARARLKASKVFIGFGGEMDRLAAALSSYTAEESIRKYFLIQPIIRHPETFWSTYGRIRSEAHAIIGKEIEKSIGVAPYSLWNTGDELIGLAAEPSLEHHFGRRFPHGGPLPDVLGDQIDLGVRSLLRPWLVIAEIADFYRRNKLRIGSIVSRCQSDSFWGEPNHDGLARELSRFARREAGAEWGDELAQLALLERAPTALSGGTAFEQSCLETIRSFGYPAEITSASADNGVDILSTINGKLIAFQCKNHRRPIGVTAVQEVFAGARFYGASYGAVISSSGYTKAAENLAAKTGVRLLRDTDLGTASRLFA